MLGLIKRIICRGWCIIGFLFALMMILGALLLQFVWGLHPCPLCILQRIAVISALVVFLIGLLHNPKSKGGIVYGVLAFLCSAAGAFVALKQVLLQINPPPDMATCGPNLEYVFEILPFWQALSYVLEGSGDCSKIEGQWLGLTLPMWSLLGFLALMLISLLLIISASLKKPSRRSFY